jgi:hypothetical protein
MIIGYAQKTALVSIAVLFLATGTALANEERLDRCGKHLIYAWGHHGWEFFLLPKGEAVAAAVVDMDHLNDIDETMMRFLPARQFRFVYQTDDDPGTLYFRGRKCTLVDHR